MLLLMVLFKVSFVFFESFTRPIFSWDARDNWSSGAKLFFYNKGLLLDSKENFFGKGYRTYLGHPLNHPLLQVWISLWIGKFHEVYSKVGAAFYYIAILSVFYINAKKDLGWFWAVVSLFFLSSMPLLTYHATDAYADLTLSFYSLSGVLCFWNYMKARRNEYLILSGILIALGCLTKNEGFFYFIAVFVSVMLFLRDNGGGIIVQSRYLWLPFLIIAGPWVLFKLFFGIGYGHWDESSGFRLFVDPSDPTADPGLNWEVVYLFLKEMFLNSNFNVVSASWIVLAILSFGRKCTSIFLLNLILLLVMSMFLLTYVMSEATAVTEATGVHRNALTYMPIMLYSTVLLAKMHWRSRQLEGFGCIGL